MENMTLQTVERALMVLEIVAIEPKSQKELEEITGLNRSNVRRLVFTLMNNGYLEKDSNTSKFRLGLKVVELSSIRLNQVEIKTEAQPYLRELSLKTNQVCHMGTYADGEVVYIEKIQPVNNINMFSSIGRRLPVYSSSMGKVLLSQFTDNEVIDILKSVEIKKLTPKTHTDINELIKQVQKARIDGYAFDVEENEDGIFCIGAPIYDYRNKIVAAISTSGNNKEHLEEDSVIINSVINTAFEISKRLGYSR